MELAGHTDLSARKHETEAVAHVDAGVIRSVDEEQRRCFTSHPTLQAQHLRFLRDVRLPQQRCSTTFVRVGACHRDYGVDENGEIRPLGRALRLVWQNGGHSRKVPACRESKNSYALYAKIRAHLTHAPNGMAGIYEHRRMSIPRAEPVPCYHGRETRIPQPTANRRCLVLRVDEISAPRKYDHPVAHGLAGLRKIQGIRGNVFRSISDGTGRCAIPQRSGPPFLGCRSKYAVAHLTRDSSERR